MKGLALSSFAVTVYLHWYSCALSPTYCTHSSLPHLFLLWSGITQSHLGDSLSAKPLSTPGPRPI